MSRLVVVFAGHPASGKTTAAKHAERRGFDYYCPGDLIRAEAEARERPPTSRTAIAQFVHEMEADAGNDVLVKPILTTSVDMAVDGLRRMHDLTLLREKLGNGLWIVSIISDMVECHRRAIAASHERGNRDSPDFETFQAASLAEAWNDDPLEPSVDQVMGCADYTIVNAGSREKFLAQVDAVLDNVMHQRL